MIVRLTDAGAQIIPQPDHAFASGRLARVLADEWIEQTDAETVVRLVSHHDDGWVEWEDNPRLDHRGMPVNFLDLTAAEHEAIRNRGIDQIERSLGPLAAAVLARHAQSLGREMTVAWENDLSHRYAQLARAALPDEDPVRRDWRIERAFCVLQFCDLLTLMPAAGWIEPLAVPLIHNDGRHVGMEIHPDAEQWQLGVSPWPFSRHEVQVNVPLLDVGWGEWPNAMIEFKAGRRRNQPLRIVPAD